jgi:hypothetical protein
MPVMLTAAVPVLLTMIDWFPLLPTCTDPKFTLAGDADNSPTGAAVPVPLSAMTREGSPASLVIVMDPEALPVAVGVNVVVRVTLDEGFTVAGVVTPLTLYAAPVTEIAEMCTAAVPVLFKTTCWVPLLPTCIDPKLTLVGEADNWPVGAEVPVPLNATLTVGLFGSLLVMAMLPVAAPVAAGVNVTTAGRDWPAPIVAGVAMPLTVKSLPVTATMDSVKLALPVFETVRLEVAFEPIDTVPKLIEVCPREICG